MQLEQFNLKNRNAIITGAAGMLGYEHAYALLKCEANIILTDINIKRLSENKKKLCKIFKKEIKIFKLDVSSEKSVKSVSQRLIKNSIRVDILINNAAIDPKPGKNLFSRLEDFNIAIWNKEISVGLTGAFLCTKIFGSMMVKDKKGGVILNIASDLSVIAPNQSIYIKKGFPRKRQKVKPVTYSVIKHGLIGLTKYTATYWANDKVRCNAISPGGVVNKADRNFYDKVKKLVPLNRMAKKDEYHSAVQFLCSDASSYMTGHNLIMDGGRSIW